MKLRTIGGTSIVGLSRTSSGNLGYRNDISAVSATSTTPVAIGVWHELQVRVRVNGDLGQTETWLDGVRIASLSRTENFGTTPVGRLQIGENSSGRTYDIAFDEVVAGTGYIA
jgi:hypothetical protein